jgi:thiol-disulfide isomerase/thioredoxin
VRSRGDQPIRLRVLGRLPALSSALLCLLAAGGCDQGDKQKPLAPKARSQAVAGSAPSTASAAPSAAPAPSTHAVRKLCEGQLAKPGRELPAAALSRTAAPGTPEPGAKIPVGGGKWTWVNFWAAWCVPCKEEMPRLLAWEKKLSNGSGRMRVVFVTIDDDPRQLRDFLAAQPAGGVRATYWLREGKQREDWLKAAAMDPDPELPAHLLVDPAGKIRCTISGAVEDRDYEQVAALVGG